ncbi:MAG: tryptophan 2,3-dioxygenase [Armatimonadota bacterium]
MKDTKPLTYDSYLRIQDLLTLQRRLTQAHDELQFITVHQVFELWFNLLVFELESLRSALQSADVPTAAHLLRRVHEIVHNLTAGFTVIETMRPHDFLEFRSELKPASGFQSLQFREIEFISGAKDEQYLRTFDDAPPSVETLRRRLGEPTVWDAFVALLRSRGLAAASDAEIIGSVIRIQKEPALAPLLEVVEGLIEYDLLWSLWRQRHILMVERMIGARPGTGHKSVARVMGEGYESMGSGGVEYLRSTTGKKFFPLLWEARTFLER